MSTNTRDEARKWEVQDATKAGADWLGSYVTTLEAALADARRYRANYEAAANGEARTQVLSWAANHATGVLPNVRLDLAVSAAARLAGAEARLTGEGGAGAD